MSIERHCNKICREILARKIEVLCMRSMHFFMRMLIITATLILKLNSDQSSIPPQASHMNRTSFYLKYTKLTAGTSFYFLCSYKAFK